ncbi:hypothetical protein QJS66_04370 [Kocuria rhizophila]|nr:hypothetical protein QJS66_04370 [Kocuria rhizophila]
MFLDDRLRRAHLPDREHRSVRCQGSRSREGRPSGRRPRCRSSLRQGRASRTLRRLTRTSACSPPRRRSCTATTR